MNKTYCYIRVSIDKQEYDRQIQALKDNGYINGVNSEYIEETFTGTKTKRPEFDKLINKMEKGDTLVCESLSRLSRGGVIKTLELITDLIQEKHINVTILYENFYLRAGEKLDANTNLLLGIFSVLGQFERDLISERTKEALKAKRENGEILGRPSGKYTTLENFIETLKLRINGYTLEKSTLKTRMPLSTYRYWLRKYKKKYKTNSEKQILNILSKEVEND